MVPLRATMEATGAAVGYDVDKKTAIIITANDRIEVPVGSSFFYNNNNKIQNDTYAVISGGRIYLPIRAVLESADYTVEWESSTQTVNVYNFSYNLSTLTPYNTSDPNLLLQKLLSGDVVCIDGQFYATPAYVKSIANTVVHYSGSDLNTAIYPQRSRTDYKTSENKSEEQTTSGDIDSKTWVKRSNFKKWLMSIDECESLGLEPYEYAGGGIAFVYGFVEVDTVANYSKCIYYVDEITEEFLNAETAVECFNGIHMMKDNGELYFFSKDLEALGL